MRNPKDRIIVALFLLLIVFALFSVIVLATENTGTSARGAVLYEPKEKNFLYEKNADIRLPMASTTKIMTALVALENADINEKIVIPKEACGIEGSSLYLRAGEIFTLKDLVYALMLRSANDVAEAIAISVGGSTENFVDMMNDKATALGLKDTHFDNPHGLDGETHYTTARELAKITAAAMENDAFLEITKTYKTVLKNDEGEARLVVNHNKLLKMYDGAIGVKTGYTKKCGRCLVGAAERDGLRLITVTLDASDDWNDHIRLFDLGFSKIEQRTLALPYEFTYELPVVGSETETLTVSNEIGFSKIMNKSAANPEIELKLDRYLVAPVKSGDTVGEIYFTQNGEIIGKLPLIAQNSAEKSDKKRLFQL